MEEVFLFFSPFFSLSDVWFGSCGSLGCAVSWRVAGFFGGVLRETGGLELLRGFAGFAEYAGVREFMGGRRAFGTDLSDNYGEKKSYCYIN